ncbi:MAG: hypothetical protein EA398_01900 [Deltaproteobacteria bacterium]|nr:MAG: hypothetical protein EA398_01900 [Deltaproteobacteria bacterium]
MVPSARHPSPRRAHAPCVPPPEGRQSHDPRDHPRPRGALAPACIALPPSWKPRCCSTRSPLRGATVSAEPASSQTPPMPYCTVNRRTPGSGALYSPPPFFPAAPSLTMPSRTLRFSGCVLVPLLALVWACGGDNGSADSAATDSAGSDSRTSGQPGDPSHGSSPGSSAHADASAPPTASRAAPSRSADDPRPGTTDPAGATDVTDPTLPDSSASTRWTWAPQAWEDCEEGGRILEAGPDDYRDVLNTLEPGDTLRLRPGIYTRGLPLRRSGEPGACIVIESLDPEDRATFHGSNSFNSIAIHGASWIKVRRLIVDGRGQRGFGVASQGLTEMPTHHVVIEDIHIFNQHEAQSVVGISTKSPAWDWVIRGNRIENAGTGLYLGNSDGRQPFIRGIVEFNTVLDPLGYGMQIKHQIERPDIPGIPARADTHIRYNVFSKANRAASGGNARPNLLLGHFPVDGPGADDRYLVYGNLFHDNPVHHLIQAEGNLALFNNLFVNPRGNGVHIRPHNHLPRTVDVFHNTFVTSGRALRIAGGDPDHTQRASHNALFGNPPVDGPDTAGNITGAHDDATDALRNPHAAPGDGLDLRPRGDLLHTDEDSSTVPDILEAHFDFAGHPRQGTVAGAFAGPDVPLPWPLTREAPPVPASPTAP